MIDLTGTGVALVTPFDADLKIDYSGLERLLQHVTPYVDYLTVMGTTGENPTINMSDQIEILSFIKSRTKLPVVFGFSGNDTFSLESPIKTLCEQEIDALLVASPYYSRPSQAGIELHYEHIADWSDVPVILYNVPARTASNIDATTTLNLAQHSNIIGVKEASGDLNQCMQIQLQRSENFYLLSGDDASTHEMIQMGANGVISVIANLLPEETSALVKSRDKIKSKEQDDVLRPVYELLTREGNPSSVKAGLEAMKICNRHVRLPLTPASDLLKVALASELEAIKKGV